MDLPAIPAHATPREVLDAGGNWLAHVLGSDWKYLRSKGTVQRSLGGYRHQLRLQGSKWNRTDELVEVNVVGNVRSKALAEWRRANSPFAVRSDDWLYGAPIGNLTSEGYRAGSFDVTSVQSREGELPRLLEMIAGTVEPWFQLALVPQTFLDVASERIVMSDPPSLIEWFLSHSLRDEAARVARLAAAAWPQERIREGIELSRSGGRPLEGNNAVLVGWLADANGLELD